MKGDILHRDNFFLTLFNRVNLLEYNQSFTDEKYLQELHKSQRKLSIERENVLSNNFKFSVGIVTTLALVGIILQNIYAAILSENKRFIGLALVQTKNDNIFLFLMQLLNYFVNTGMILGTCYLNIYSEGMIDDKYGTKLHKKIGKLIYKFGLFSSVLYFIDGFSKDINFYIITIAIIQAYFLIMCVSTACLKQYLSHRVWSYCLNTLFLQIALNTYLNQLANYFEQEYLISYCCCLSSIFCILYLYKQELSIDKVVPKSKATFQISLDSISQRVIIVSEKIEENPFKTVYFDKNIIKANLNYIQKAFQLFAIFISITWILLDQFAEQKTFELFKVIAIILLSIYCLIVFIPLKLRLKQMKKIKKQLKKQNKLKNNKVD
ncbi:transmembrane protein, putative (macronuclear) [Tetrahymena thermophila SB210]|uniref:Transmembrane protein, putative n=1 Tax=Tetrahymena thermophila (strain SB210) TaxID=312017 RepID=W7XKE2_TETTS|nr:transmembrane protein, putative [Tetrahymena thermophila SB210]EWS76451.1 transmembrane protein, putative [Tetrahymena thermophila SB210]|eukprot:XP_012651014.1 transmembrane protein, putative [Tetrahymena thermophila SB210]